MNRERISIAVVSILLAFAGAVWSHEPLPGTVYLADDTGDISSGVGTGTIYTVDVDKSNPSSPTAVLTWLTDIPTDQLDWPGHIAVTPDGKRLYTISKVSIVKLGYFDLINHTWSKPCTVSGIPNAPVFQASFSPDGTFYIGVKYNGLYTVDLSTCAATPVGNGLLTGRHPPNGGDIVFDTSGVGYMTDQGPASGKSAFWRLTLPADANSPVDAEMLCDDIDGFFSGSAFLGQGTGHIVGSVMSRSHLVELDPFSGNNPVVGLIPMTLNNNPFKHSRHGGDMSTGGLVLPDPVHYTCYKAKTPKGICADDGTTSCNNDKDCAGKKGHGSCVSYEFIKTLMVGLNDQFEFNSYDVVKPERLCTPTIKEAINFQPDHPDSTNVDLEGAHLEGYKIQDPSASCGECDGQVHDLTIQYTGGDTVTFTIDGKVTDIGEYTMNMGDEITLVGSAKDGKMGASIKLIDKRTKDEIASFHTSCSQPIGIGTESEDGLFVVTAGSSVNGGTFGPCDDSNPWEVKEPWASCHLCEGGVSYALFKYLGAPSVVIVENKDGNEIYNSRYELATGETFEVSLTTGKGNNEIFLSGASEAVSIHTSCSKPFGPGLVVGDFSVIEAESVKGGWDMCPVIRVDNQFGSFLVQAKKTKYLLTPTAKSLEDYPRIDDLATSVDHYKCYDVKAADAEEGLMVRLKDQFHERAFEVKKPKLLCNPVEKHHDGITPIRNIGKHLTCYEIKAVKGLCSSTSDFPDQTCSKDKDCGTGGFCEIQEKDQKIDGLYLNNQFGDERLDLDKVEELCVPSVKTVG